MISYIYEKRKRIISISENIKGKILRVRETPCYLRENTVNLRRIIYLLEKKT